MSQRVGVILAVLLSLSSVAGADHGLGSKDPGLFNLKGQLVFLPEATDHMPEHLASMKVEGTLYTESLDVPEREFTAGFPGVTNRFEWFGLTYTGRFQVTKPGSYHFHSISDDGITVWIDGKQVLEFDSIHGPADANGDVVLTAGGHDLKVWYFQGPASQLALQLFITPPGGTEKIFSMKDYAADLGAALADLGGEATPQGIKIRLDASVLFDFNKAVLKPAAHKALVKLAVVLKSYPNAAVSVGGHTSSEGDDAYNQALSEKRANAVKNALVKLAPATIGFTAVGYGESQPIADNKSEKTRIPNRRVEILVKP